MIDESGYDELAAAAALEQATALARRRRTRAWSLAFTASAGMLLLAVAALTAILGPSPTVRAAAARRSAAARPSGSPLPTLPAALRPSASAADVAGLRAKGDELLGGIGLPAGWTRGPVSVEIQSGGVVRWSTTWTAPAAGTALSQALATALQDAGWGPCSSQFPAGDECWQQFNLGRSGAAFGLYLLLLTSPCPKGVPCREVTADAVQL